MQLKQLIIREFTVEDVPATARVFFDAVRLGTASYYDQSQREAWAPRVPNNEEWSARLRDQRVFVAEQDGEVAGFVSLTVSGLIDLAFVSPRFARRGVGTSLYHRIEDTALELGVSLLRAEASSAAKPFFERLGWAVVREQTKSLNGVNLASFLMTKDL